jgi:hypothetical protein
MKIVLNDKGLAVVTAETLSESIKLQEQFMGEPKKKMGRPFGSVNRKEYVPGTGKQTRKIERRKDCPYCGKRVKRLRLHMLQKHPVEYRKMFGNTTTGGKSVTDLIDNGGWSRMKKLAVN